MWVQRQRARAGAFTLIELLVVVAIIAILLVTLRQTRSWARQASCVAS